MLNIKLELEKLASAIKAEVLKRMESEKGVNPRTGTNTLVGSKLYKSVDVKVKSETELAFQIADYYTYVVGGRKIGWGTPPPHGFIDGIIKWVKEKNIIFDDKTQNETVWAIARSIAKLGIQGREFIGNGYIDDDPSYVLPFLDEFYSKWADEVFEDICKELDVHFK